jgi:3-phosphoshikimate 1-carboxyvinyltransferase
MIIKPTQKANFEVSVPGSKSYTNRALLIAALAKGKSVLLNPLFCDDSHYMMEALKSVGVKIYKKNDRIEINGVSGKFKIPKKKIFVGNAGTAFRFLTTALALCKGKVRLDGNKRMRQRPISDLINALENLGVKINSNNGFPPLDIYGGSFNGGKAYIKTDKSSQYISSILLSAAYAENDVEIILEKELTSKPYIDITLSIMKSFGINIENRGYKSFYVKSGKTYKGKSYTIEGDASSSSYFFGAAAILGKKVKLHNLPSDSVQGDLGFINVLEQMGCSIKTSKKYIELTGKELQGINIDMNKMPDIVPTLAVVACFAKGPTDISNVANLRIKESDRIKAVCTELRKMGAEVIEKDDGMKIIPGNLHGAEIDTYDDHRIAMAFSIAGLKISGIKIKSPKCVKKSFPDYWDVFKEVFY